MSIKEKLNIKDGINFREILNYKWVKKSKDTLQKKAFKALIGFLILMIGCSMLSRFADSLTIPIVTTDSPKSKTIVDEVKATGKIVKNREDKISITEGLKVNYVNVNVGSVIKNGDVIAELDVEDLEKKASEIRENIQKEEKTLARAVEDYNRAIAVKNETVSKALNEMNSAKKALDDYKKSEDKDQMVEDNLAAEYEMKKSVYDSAVKDANDTLDLDRALQDTKDSLQTDEYNKELAKIQPYLDSNGKVTSPKDGIVTTVFTENGGVSSDAIVSLADKEAGYKFVGQIEKSKRNLVKQGQKVGVNINGSGSVEGELTIESITSSKDTQDMIDITVLLPNGVGEIDDTGDIIISSNSKKYGTCVPLNALRQGDDNNYYVLVVSEKETVLGTEKIAKKVDVRIEKRDSQYAALVEGSVARNEQIIIKSNKIIEDGDRVRLETE